jgi:hypothetical protein
MASDVGGVVGGVIGAPHVEGVGDEVQQSSIIIKLSPLAADPHELGPTCAEYLGHPKLTSNGEEALWL